MSKRILNKKIEVEAREVLTLSQFAEKVANIVSNQDIPTFIAMLEKLYEDWDVTEELINHFDAVKIEYQSAFAKSEQNLNPKNLLS